MRILLIACFLIFIRHAGLSQSVAKYITNYGPEITKSVGDVFSVCSDKDGILYFAVTKGVLVYDGDQWGICRLESEFPARTVEYDSGTNRVLVGGVGTFGYIKRNREGRYAYTSLTYGIEKRFPIKDVWQAMAIGQETLFQTTDGMFTVRGDSVTFRDIKNALFYYVDDDLYFSSFGGPLSRVEGESLVPVWDQKLASGNQAFHIIKYGIDHLIFYPSGRIFKYNVKDQTVKQFGARITTLIGADKIYSLTQLSDSTIAIGTDFAGIIITDYFGNSVTRIDSDVGLPSDGIWDMEVDRFGKLWAATENEISVVDLKLVLPNIRLSSKPAPACKLTSVRLNGDSLLSMADQDTLIQLTRKPSRMKFNFATPGLDFFADHVYAVRLVGLDSNWRTVTDPFVEYSNLPNGEFVFNAKSMISGRESMVATYAFHIMEPWYVPVVDVGKYPALGVLVFVVAVFGLTRRLRQRKNALAEMVRVKTEEIEANRLELIRMNESLKQVNDELDTFLYRSSHDLIAPIKSVKGLLALMKLPGENREAYFGLMEDRISKFETLLTEIGTFVKNAKKVAVRNRINMKEMVESVWSEVEFMDEAKGIRFEVLIDKELIIESDTDRLRMVIANLVINSAKYHDIAQSNRYIRVTARSDYSSVLLSVEDNGQGISIEHQKHLFEMFYRANENSIGSGLGLFLAKKMVERLGGTIRLESQPLKGTMVTISIPV